MNKNHLLGILNKEQREAVTTLDGPILIVAGAGSGNTKRTFKRSADDLEQTKSKVIDVMSKIESANFQPKVSYQCKFCDYPIFCPAYK